MNASNLQVQSIMMYCVFYVDEIYSGSANSREAALTRELIYIFWFKYDLGQK